MLGFDTTYLSVRLIRCIDSVGDFLERVMREWIILTEKLVVVPQVDRLNRSQDREQVRLENCFMLVLLEHDDKLTFKGALWVPLRRYEWGEEAESMQY